ncbi:N-6 DNA methylase [Rhizorhabdus sp. FW153]|uniref:N-6 DNA methylase n=1 Tax=Rhizorhabdus sp. FW153 TaxID=3400216 RepID=UPI003CED5B82
MSKNATRLVGKFYTPAKVAKRLIALVPTPPESILDLCSGPGALSSAALDRWRPANVVTIDNDPEVRPEFDDMAEKVHRHVVADALRLHDGSLGPGGTFDLVLTNPPFGHRPSCEYLSQSVDRSITGRGDRSVTAEMAALGQALWFLKSGGIVASIMPDTLVAGTRARWFRQRLEQLAELVAVESLPPSTFRRTDAKAYLVVLRKYRLPILDGNEAGLHLADLPSSDWRVRMAPEDSSAGEKLTDLGVQVVRGVTSATTARAERRALFHTDGFVSAADHGLIELRGRNPYPDAVEAGPGDILIARVDRNIENKVALVTSGTLPISDCVYRLRCPQPVTERVWRWLRSPDGRTGIAAAVRGVSARHLPKDELLNLRIG